MKKRKLKKFVLPTVYLCVLGIMAFAITFLSQSLLKSEEIKDDYYNYSMSVFDETNEPSPTPEKEEEDKIIKPFESDKVTVAKEFYNKEESNENQEKALIYYENTYMPNTGILYESDEIFDVLAIYDGTVKDIKQDEILGSVLTIENNQKLTSIYYTLGEIKVKVGDQVNKGEVVAISGTSKLETKKPQTLLFETYLNGVLTNPNTLFAKSMSELN